VNNLPTRAFWISMDWSGSADDDLLLYGSWAYTAP
jgi:hypothetical protein